MMFRDASNALVEVELWCRDTANTLVQIAPKVRDASASLIDVAGASSELTATPDYDSVVGATMSHTPVPTNVVTVTVSGGKEPYSVEWAAAGPGWTIANPASLSTRFICAPVSPGDTEENTFTCTVTDANDDTASCDVAASVTNFGA